MIDFDSSNDVNDLHSYLFSRQAKPYAAIDALFSALMPYGQPFVLKPGEELPFIAEQGNQIILLEEGIVAYCRSGDRMHITSGFAPALLGLVDCYGATYDVINRPTHYLCAETECRGRAVALVDFIRIADECDLWHDIARFLAYRLMVMYARDRELVGVDSYLKVRALLIELWAYPEDYRKGINVLSFIQRRTGISRSRTLKILSELKKGSYINIDNGRLVSIRKLPLAY
ncbi:MAG: helix-turn-helix domain-containing protein [Kluyvera sp.]|uniref:winged helix-turn-helix transcriptional regulator n=1 Tax=Kluyvera sp. TaxID=1538228 RepID=UPI003A8A408D